MGLDMYLEGKHFVWSSEKRKIKIEGLDTHGFEVKQIEVRLGYWRKANAIHRWFVDNIQDGIDECQESWVEKDDLMKLLNICKEIVEDNSRAPILLPTQEGFFFGGTDYDEWYFRDVEETIEIIEKVLKLPKGWDIYYRASW